MKSDSQKVRKISKPYFWKKKPRRVKEAQKVRKMAQNEAQQWAGKNYFLIYGPKTYRPIKI